MYKITKEEVMSLLQKMRQIRQASGEMIAFLEHLIQLQEDRTQIECEPCDPDAYLHSWAQHPDHPMSKKAVGDIVSLLTRKEGES